MILAPPITVVKGEILTFIEETNPKSDRPYWIFCKGDGKEGWIPKQILKINGSEVTTFGELYGERALLNEE